MPADQKGIWLFSVARSDPVIDPVILASAGKSDEEGFAFNRVAVRARIDTVRHRIDLEQGDFSRVDTRPAYNVAVAVTGSLDYSGAVPHLAFGVAGTRMPMEVMMRLWPVITTVPCANGSKSHMSGGIVERVVIAGNAPLPDFKAGGPPDGRLKVCRSISRPAARRCVRSTACRRSAMPISRFTSPAPPPM